MPAAQTTPPNRIAALLRQRLRDPRFSWITRPLLVFLLTRLIVLLGGVYGAAYLPEAAQIGRWHLAPEAPLLDMYARWDSIFYVQIAGDGYRYTPGEISHVAFFPLYPLLIKLAAPLLGGNAVLAGVLISNIAFLLALMALYRLALFEFERESLALYTILFTALAPTALFFSALYTESLFLLVSVLSFYYARQRRWLPAAIFGALSAATRLVGLLLWGVAGLEWLRAHGWTLDRSHTRQAWAKLWRGLRTDWRSAATLCLIPVGLLAYMLLLAAQFGDPLLFISNQQAFGLSLAGPLAALAEAVEYLAAGQAVWWCLPLDFTAFVIGLGISVALWRRLGASYALYGILSVLLPVSASTRSMSRYVVVIFPLFMILAWWTRERPRLRAALLVLSGAGLFLFMALFSRWYFVG